MIQLTKASEQIVSSLFALASSIEQRQAVARFAEKHQLGYLLANYPVVKAYAPIGKDFVIAKSWTPDGSTDCLFEGWVHTTDEDREWDIIAATAFSTGMDDYFVRCAPISYIHNGQTLPAGHVQKAASVVAGKIVKSVLHPLDPADFEHFTNTGNGTYIRAVLNDAAVADSVRKGNCRGLSFIGNASEYSPCSPRGRHITQIDPWIESTVAPYPINTKAIITIAKAYGLEEPTEKEPMSDSTLEQLLAKLLEAKEEAPVQKAEPITLEQIAALLVKSQETVLAAVDTKVQKAMELVREEGAGSKMPVITSVLPNENPLYPIVQKANKGEELSEGEVHLLNAATHAILASGMNDSGDAAMSDWFKGVGN